MVVWYIISKLDGVLGRTHLQKMMFLTDLLSSKKFQKPISVMEYKKYHYGPYTQDLAEYTSFLEGKGLIEERELTFISDASKKYSRFYSKKPFTDKSLLIKAAGGADQAMLIDEVIGSYGNMGLQDVLDIVYGLQDTSAKGFNDPFEFARKMGETKKTEEPPF